jgi:ribosomal protein L21E
MKVHYLITTSLVAVSFLAIQPVSARSVMGSSNYGGKTTVVTKNNDGTHTVSVTDANGKTTSTVKGKMPAGISVDDGNGGFKPYVPPAKSPVIGSSTYEGKTTVVAKNSDGTHTVSVTDANGKTISIISGGNR